MGFDSSVIKAYWNFFKLFNDGSSVFGWLIGKIGRGYDERGDDGYFGYEVDSNLFKLLFPFKLIIFIDCIMLRIVLLPIALLFSIKF